MELKEEKRSWNPSGLPLLHPSGLSIVSLAWSNRRKRRNCPPCLADMMQCPGHWGSLESSFAVQALQETAVIRPDLMT